MGVQIAISPVERIIDGLWLAELQPAQVRRLGSSQGTLSGPSVMMAEAATEEESSERLLVDQSAITVLNVGTTPVAFIVSGGGEGEHRRDRMPALPLAPEPGLPARSGDEQFLDALPMYLRPLGEDFLRALRSEFPGELWLRDVTGRFQETPDNWWTIKPQPRARSFRVTMRAQALKIDGHGILVQRDRNDSYSNFTFRDASELPAVLAILRQAAQNRKR
jgi:hypothetical protein